MTCTIHNARTLLADPCPAHGLKGGRMSLKSAFRSWKVRIIVILAVLGPGLHYG